MATASRAVTRVDEGTLAGFTAMAAARLNAAGATWEQRSGVSSSLNYGAVGGRFSSLESESRVVSLWLEDDESFWLDLRTADLSYSVQIFVPVWEREVLYWITALACGEYKQPRRGNIDIGSGPIRLRSR